ncbi:MAG: MFS transporter [Dehalococcoidia bacterium]|nr:MAG: MFS transporter [Dehalococcoidia bacterium]
MTLSAPTASAPRRASRLPGPFAALRHRDYRLLWSGMISSSTTLWMEQVAYGWLVLQLTNSPFLLGFVGFCRALPTLLFSLFAGVLADRLDRRRVLLAGQSVTWATITTLALLTTTGLVQVWHVFVAAFLAGSAQAFNLPTRQAIINDAVGKEDLPQAIALNSLSFNVAKVIGPSIAGVVVATLGTTAVFWTESVLLLFTLLTTFLLRLPPRPPLPAERSPLRDLAEGFAYVRRDRYILGLMLAAGVPVLLAWPYQTLLPVVARDALGSGAEGLGVLMSASGIGAIATILGAAALRQRGRRQTVQFLAMAAFGVLLVLFASSSQLWLSTLIIAGITGSSILYNILNQTALQTYVDDRVRGRVLGIYLLVMGLNPIGALVFGGVADHFGIRLTLFFMGVLTVSAAGLIYWLNPALRQQEGERLPRPARQVRPGG